MNIYFDYNFFRIHTDHVKILHGKCGAPCGTCRTCRRTPDNTMEHYTISTPVVSILCCKYTIP